MAKITGLPLSGPLTGTETMPIVQGGFMKQAPVSDVCFRIAKDSEAANLARFVAEDADGKRRRPARFRQDGTFLAKLGISVGIANGLTLTRNADETYTFKFGTVEGTLPLPAGATLTSDSDSANLIKMTGLDSLGRRRRIWSISTAGVVSSGSTSNEEVTSARGPRDTLDTRMSQGLTAYGNQKTPILFRENMKALRSKVGQIRNGITPVTGRLLQAGDSWIDGAGTYGGRYLWNRMRVSTSAGGLGASHLGWTSAAKSQTGSFQAGISPSLTVAWSAGAVNNALNGNGPALASVTLPTGESVTLTVSSAASGTVNAIRVITGIGGTYSYSWDGGSATNIVLSGTGPQINTPPGYPGSGAQRTLTITAVSGPVTLYGFDVQSGTTTGWVQDKCGHGGTTSFDWVSADWTILGAIWAALAPDAVMWNLGTNDQAWTTANQNDGSGVTPENFYTNMSALVQRTRTYLPLADVILQCPPENSAGRSTPMTDYRDVLEQIASEQGCVLIDNCRSWGAESTYGYRSGGGTLGLIDSTNLHPTAAGAGLLTETHYNLIMGGL
jgi:hypothetical protein